ncbi:ArnT family glycosyltransferase [Mesorhizobium caraganae]|uniref:ArnT family glycosyltransferase n=1 Tax=Mesorhizobium caraganae TaxID=483206 RepID=UPI00333BF19A
MNTQEPGPNKLFALGQRPTTSLLHVLIALKIILLFVLAWNIRFVMDEFVQLGWAKYFSNGLFDTIWHPKAVGYAVFYEIAHLIGWNATSILLAGRMQSALLACGTIALIYACARALGEDRVRSLTIVLILLCFSNFMERIFRTIAEPPAVFFAVAALLVILRAPALSARQLLAAGMLSGLAFLTTQKSVYFNVALGVSLVADAALMRRYATGAVRGGWLVLGWAVPVIVYCFIFGGGAPVLAAKNLILGPVEIATRGGGDYGGLRQFVVQTLARNAILYGICFSGMALSLMRIMKLDERRRIALIFSLIVTALVFAHDQPWPYVFIMALPFIALWSLELLDVTAAYARYRVVVLTVLITAMAMSYASDVVYLRLNNQTQLELVARAETLLAPGEKYFDGIGMLPNRQEPSTLWLDQHHVLKTLQEGRESEAYKILSDSPPKVVLWSYRMDMIDPVIAPLIRDSYVQIAPNIRMAGRRLRSGRLDVFKVPVPGRYNLYTTNGQPADGKVEINGTPRSLPLSLEAGVSDVVLRSGPAEALLLPEGDYENLIVAGEDNAELFRGIYN